MLLHPYRLVDQLLCQCYDEIHDSKGQTHEKLTVTILVFQFGLYLVSASHHCFDCFRSQDWPPGQLTLYTIQYMYVISSTAGACQ